MEGTALIDEVGEFEVASGATIHYRSVGPPNGVALMLGLPLMASHTTIFGPDSGATLNGYLDRLTDVYRVLLVDYPNIGKSTSPPPAEMTAERVCSDLLATADAAGFGKFVYWAYSWGGAAALQLASRSARLSALVVGGWPPLGGQYADILRAARRQLDDPPPSARVVLREPAQYAQWVTFYESVLDWPEQQAIGEIDCPRMVFFGGRGDVDPGGEDIHIAGTIRKRRGELRRLGWSVHEIADRDHSVCLDASAVVPPVRAFLDEALSGTVAR